MARARTAPGAITFPGSRLVVSPSPEQIRRDLLLLARNIKDYEKPLMLSKQSLIDDVKASFESETDPVTGAGWKALSERAAREPRMGILQRTIHNRRMYRAVTSKQNWGVSKQGVFINVRSVIRMAPYAPLHQQDDKLASGGLPKLSQAKLDSLVLAERKRLVAAKFGTHYRSQAERIQRIRDVAVKNVKANLEEEHRAAHRIPQRRFIGPSEYTKNLLVKQFDQWAEDAIIIYRRGGRVVVRRRVVP